jgi:hypothetical protein
MGSILLTTTYSLRKKREISFGCSPGVNVDLVRALKDAGIAASGFAQKATVETADGESAIEVVRRALPS